MTAGTAAGPDTGAGGTATTTSNAGLFAGLVALGGIGAIAARRRGEVTA